MGFRHGWGSGGWSLSVVEVAAVVALAVFLGVLATLVQVGTAQAEEPPYSPPTSYEEPAFEPEATCPAAPEPLAEPPPPSEGPEEEESSGPDPVVSELRAARIEAVQICQVGAAADREQLRRLWWVVAELDPMSSLGETTNERLAELLGSSCSNPCSVVVEGGHVSVDGGEGGGGLGEAATGELVASVDAGAEGTTYALWAIVGLLVAVFFGAAVLKVLDRAA